MRKGIGASVSTLIFLGATSCISGDIDEEKPVDRVPAGITPESATFHVDQRHDGTQHALVIRMSSISFCNKAEVPLDHPFVEVELAIPSDHPFAPEDCRLDQTFRCRVRIARTTAPECASVAGTHASEGHVQIEEVTEDLVRGNYVGTSTDSKVDLRGSFVARRCEGSASCP